MVLAVASKTDEVVRRIVAVLTTHRAKGSWREVILSPHILNRKASTVTHHLKHITLAKTTTTTSKMVETAKTSGMRTLVKVIINIPRANEVAISVVVALLVEDKDKDVAVEAAITSRCR